MHPQFDDILSTFEWERLGEEVEREFTRPRQKPLTYSCVDCGGAPGNLLCSDCYGTGEVD